MASASGVHIRAEVLGRGREVSNSGGGVPGAAQKVRLLRAVLFRSHALGQNPSCCIDNFKTTSLSRRRDVTLRFETLPAQVRFPSAVGAESGGQSAHRRAQAFAKGASEVPGAKPARISKSTSETEVKKCPDCKHSKLLVDFEKTVTSMDGLTDVCRACLTVLRAKSMQKELHHLGMSVTEAWERAKACTRCGLTKELRDFQRDAYRKDQTQNKCRACVSMLNAAKPQLAPTDQSLRCNRCGEVRAADQFALRSTSSTGRDGTCKSCRKEKSRQLIQIRRNTQIYLPRETKVCGACGKQKQACEFHSNTAAVDGLQSVCRSCMLLAGKKRHELRKQGELRKQASTED